MLDDNLKVINKYVSPNIKRYGWAATAEKSIADVALLTWISAVIFNEFAEEDEDRETHLKKCPTLD